MKSLPGALTNDTRRSGLAATFAADAAAAATIDSIVGVDEIARRVLDSRVRKLVLARVRQLDVSDRAGRLLHLTGHAVIAFPAKTDRPLHILATPGPDAHAGLTVVR